MRGFRIKYSDNELKIIENFTIKMSIRNELIEELKIKLFKSMILKKDIIPDLFRLFMISNIYSTINIAL